MPAPEVFGAYMAATLAEESQEGPQVKINVEMAQETLIAKPIWAAEEREHPPW